MRVIRVSIIVGLALALGAVPLVADWCALSCETAHSAASSATAAPACHHVSVMLPHLGEIPMPCGHDHHPVVVDGAIAATAARVTPALSIPAAHVVAPPSSLRAASTWLAVAAASPPLEPRLACPLRI